MVAVADKIAAMSTEEIFAERRARADLAELDRILSRKGGEPPAPTTSCHRTWRTWTAPTDDAIGIK